MADVIEYDTIQAQEMLSSVFGAEYARSATNVEAVARFMATHRQAAEKAQQERDAGVVKKHPMRFVGMTEAYIRNALAIAIRSQDHE